MPHISVYYGNGYGKTSAALGNAIKAAGAGKTIYIVQFLKGLLDSDFIKRLEPEIKTFRFERSADCFADLNDEEKKEEKQNILNGLFFAKKVLTTGECDMLILDEVLGIIDEGIITEQELIDILKTGSEDIIVIMTGTHLSNKIREVSDKVFNISAEK